MANKTFVYTIKLDVKDGIVQTDKLEGELKQLKTAIHEVNEEGKDMGKNLGQTASKAGLAGAAIVEMGRTISDANYGMVAMTNNIQQLSTLLVTLVSTTGGVKQAFTLLRSQLMGPLGLIIGFQILFTVIERFSMNARKAEKVTKDMKTATDALAVSVRDITKDERERLKVNKDLTDEMAAQLLTQEMALEAEQLRLEMRKPDIEEDRRIRALLGGDTTEFDEQLNALDAQIRKFAEKRQQLIDLLRGKGGGSGDGDKDKIQTIPTAMMGSTWEWQQLGSGLVELYEKHGLKMHEIQSNGINEMTDNQRVQNAMMEAEEKRHLDAMEVYHQKKIDNKILMIGLIGDAIRSFGEIIGRETELGKGVAAAGAIIDTAAAVTSTLREAKLPGPLRIAQAVAVGAFGLAQVAKIYQTRVPRRGGGGGSSSAASVPQITPQFNIIGSTGPNRIGEAVRGALADRPVKAYVTTKDIRSGQELDRNTRSGASLN